MSKLRFAPNLSLPLDVVTQRLAFLGRIGSGKTYAATKLIELMLEAHAQVVALDPVGKCYGLRVPGTGAAFDIPIFGGLHGDVPLEPTGGALIADLVVDRALSCVIDVSQFETDAAKAKFAAAFAERFFFRKKASPSAVHVFLEECQEFVPQNIAKGEELMLHHWTRMAKLGRNFGIGLSLASQRPQEVNKKVLNLTECLFAFQLRGKHERLAVKDWITEKDSDRGILDELPKLAVGDAIVDSPQWLGTTMRVRAFAKRTADVSATPKVGEKPASERPLTAVDIAQLRDAMGATIERAKAGDPKALRVELARVTKERDQALKAVGDTASAPVIKRSLDAEYRRGVTDGEAAGRVAAMREVKRIVGKDLSALSGVIDKTKSFAARLDGLLADVVNGFNVVSSALSPASTDETLVTQTPERLPVAASQPRPVVAQRSDSTERAAIPRTQLKVLDAIADLQALRIGQPSRGNIGAWLGVSASTGSFKNYLGALRTAGLIDYPGDGLVALTKTGDLIAERGNGPRSLQDLHRTWLDRLPGTHSRVLSVVLECGQAPVSRVDIAARLGVSHETGSFKNYLGALRSLGLIDYPADGMVAATDLLFPEGLL